MKSSNKPKYKPIWEALKRTGHCEIVALREHHATIIRMVGRNRDRDLGFHFRMDEEKLYHKIQAKKDGNKIKFTLTYRSRLDGI